MRNFRESELKDSISCKACAEIMFITQSFPLFFAVVPAPAKIPEVAAGAGVQLSPGLIKQKLLQPDPRSQITSLPAILLSVLPEGKAKKPLQKGADPPSTLYSRSSTSIVQPERDETFRLLGRYHPSLKTLLKGQ